MTIDKLVDSTQLDSDLTDVADEIRTAGGTLLPLSFPDDYVVAIGDIGNTEIKTASGSIAHFEDALARKAQDLTVAVEPVQSGSGDPSPDNVRPISGWTGANIHVSPTTDAEDGTTYSITFPTSAGTVYGGTLDVTTGKLTVTKFALDLGTLSFEQSASYTGRFFASFPTDNPPVWYAGSSESAPPRFICSSYTAKLYTSIWAGGETGVSQFVRNNGAAVGICDTRFSDAQSFTEYVNGKILVYELATPIVYDLSPTEVTTLLGTNNVWADTGDSTIKYIAPKAQIPSAQGVYF